MRGTKNSWLTLIDKGEVTPLKSPEIRALASRYGNPDEVLSDDWAPYIPGSTRRENFRRLRQGPVEDFREVMRKIEAGTFEYFYPAVKARK